MSLGINYVPQMTDCTITIVLPIRNWLESRFANSGRVFDLFYRFH